MWGVLAMDARQWTAAIGGVLFLAILCAGCGGGGGAKGKVVVIGLDGATWELIQPWIDQGDLPTLARLQGEGAWGEMQSCVPYLSPPAWASAVTGVNPGKHNIYSFQRRLPGEVTFVNETAKSRRAQPIWNMLRPSKRRVLLLNIPMTDPPDEVDGYMVAGFPHQDKTGFTYPPELESELEGYELEELEIRLVPQREDSLLQMYHRHLRKRTEITLDWLKNEPFDLLWMVYTATDRIQHTFWTFNDPDNPHYDPRRVAIYGNAIHDFWVEQDRALGEVLAQIGPDVTTLILSDHGFGPMRYDLRVQDYLRRPGSSFLPNEADAVISLDRGDATRLFVLTAGRDPHAIWTRAEALRIRAKLVRELREARHPATGGRVCEEVWVNEEVFEGPYVEKGPDVVVLPEYGYFLTLGDPETAEPFTGPVPHSAALSGWHRMNGLYVATGPNIRPGRRSADGERLYSLMDVVPTVLYAMGEPIPEGLDGEIMRGIFQPSFMQDNPPLRSGPLPMDDRQLTQEEIDRLVELGSISYIGD